ncbi:hypothetical protein NFI96_034282 [Prochilodus magdalenae]|nr:hypothetical protein NFI96_034282 [Prochilodus magdalenae]
MKLYLAIAALMLVLAAHADAEEETTIEQHFANFHSKVMEIGSDLSEKAATAFKKLEESEFATKARSWFEEQFAKLKGN